MTDWQLIVTLIACGIIWLVVQHLITRINRLERNVHALYHTLELERMKFVYVTSVAENPDCQVTVETASGDRYAVKEVEA